MSPSDKLSFIKNLKEKGQLIVAHILKAALNRSNPTMYPMDKAADGSIEKITSDAMLKLSPAILSKIGAKATSLLADPTRRAQMLGKFKDVDFKKSNISTEIKRFSPVQLKPNLKLADDDGLSMTPVISTPASAAGVSVGGADLNDPYNPAYSKIHFVLQRLRCMDETNPESGTDDMIIGGIMVGCGGGTRAANSIISCEFDDGDVCNHGAIPLTYANLGSCNSWPKNFWFIAQLVEVDDDEAEAAAALKSIMQTVSSAMAALGYVQVGVVVAAMAEIMGDLSSWLIDNDPFPPYGIQVTYANPNHFGSDARTKYRVTGNISGHDGRYKIGYFWQLN